MEVYMAKRKKETETRSPRRGHHRVYFTNDIEAGRFAGLYSDVSSPEQVSYFENCEKYPYFVELFCTEDMFKRIKTTLGLKMETVGYKDGYEYANWVFN